MYPLVTTAEHFGTSESFQFETAAVCIPLVSSTGHGHASIKRIHHISGRFALASILAAAIVKDPAQLSSRFLAYYLDYVKTRLIAPQMTGVANMTISLTRLSSIPVEYPGFHEQERIVRLLDEADELRKLRAQAGKRMADFIPALFHEMFGDPITNPKEWPVKRLGEVCSVVSGLWAGKKPPYRTVNVVRNTNFRKRGRLSLEDVAEIQVEDRQYESRSLVFGDLILEKSGGGPKQPVGRVAQFNATTGAWSYSNFTSRIRVLDEQQLAADFLWMFLTQVYEKGQTRGMQSQTTGIRNLNLNAYRGIPVPLPPRSLQQKFSAWVSVEREIEARQSSSEEQAEALFQSMLHRAFEGEL